MAWLELHQQLQNHPKLLHLTRLLGEKDRDLVRAKLENIWLWCLDHAEQGVVQIDNRLPLDVWVKEAARWNGPTGSADQPPTSLPIKKAGPEQDPSSFFADCLLEAGWVEKVAAGSWGYKLQIHDWQDYAGRLMEQRRQDRERKRAARSGGSPADGGRTVPNRTQPNRTQPEEGSATPLFASLGTPEEEREVDRTVGAFGFCSTPGIPAKQAAIRDLRRQGLTHEFLRAIAYKQEAKDFYVIVREMSKGKATPDFRPTGTTTKTCRRCAGLEKVQDPKAPIGATALIPCPDCVKPK